MKNIKEIAREFTFILAAFSKEMNNTSLSENERDVAAKKLAEAKTHTWRYISSLPREDAIKVEKEIMFLIKKQKIII